MGGFNPDNIVVCIWGMVHGGLQTADAKMTVGSIKGNVNRNFS
jgi:hypothetical protein